MEHKVKYLFKVTLLLAVIVQSLVIALVALGVPDKYFTNTALKEASESTWFMILLSTVIAPILETLIFQFGIYYILRIICKLIFGKTEKALYIMPSIITALIFASQHYYSPIYVLIMIPIALVFQYTFTKTLYETNSKLKSILMTSTQHFIYNFAVIVVGAILVIVLEIAGIHIEMEL